MEELVILDFCAACGDLLQEGLGREPAPTCFNCGASVEQRKDRIQGSFTKDDAEKLILANDS